VNNLSKHIAVVIPCYKVENHIESVVHSIPEMVQTIVLVNDCSPDKTPDILNQLALNYPSISVIHHKKNKGVGGAMLSGFEKAFEMGADIAIKLDGDGQMDASNINHLIQPILKEKADFAKGNRFKDHIAIRQMPIIRRIGNIGLSFFIKAASGYWNIFDPTNGYIAITKEIYHALDKNRIHQRYYFESSLLIELYHVNAVIEDVPMKAKYGNEVSNLSVTKTLFEFPPKLFLAFLRRILLKYFLYEFTIASLYLLTGLPLLLIGIYYGISNFIHYVNLKVEAPTGTVIIPTLMITLGFQLLLAAINFDIGNYPKK
jgi:glycosyltransferase involved in cell wall biosynthesis